MNLQNEFRGTLTVYIAKSSIREFSQLSEMRCRDHDTRDATDVKYHHCILKLVARCRVLNDDMISCEGGLIVRGP
jgi:hypothetical protein